MFIASAPSGSPTTLMAAGAAIQSVKDGSWSDASTWDLVRVPGTGDNITISALTAVVYDLFSDQIVGEVLIKGTLRFSRVADTRLRTNDNILVMGGGHLDMGTPVDYIPKEVKAEVIWVLTQEQANAYVGGANFEPTDKGLWAMSGRWDVHGQPLLTTWSKLAQDAGVGSNFLIVENDVTDWYVSGNVVISQTEFNPQNRAVFRTDISGDEVHIIQSLEKLADGKTKITLTRPLEYNHDGTYPFSGEVALLTRNVLFKTELAYVVDESVYFDDVTTRKFAHTMYMAGAKGDLQYAEFNYMGHYGKLARYATHHHRMLEASRGMVVRGTAGWYNGFRCVNLHVAHGVIIEDNVCYRSSSTAYFVEQEDELGYNEDNVFVHNIAIATMPRPRSVDVAGESRVAGFWPGETFNEAFLGNVAAGGGGIRESMGFHFAEAGAAQHDEGTIPFTFISNEVHNDLWHGIWAWQNNAPYRDFVDSLFWRNGGAAVRWGAYENAFRFFNSQFLENEEYGLNIISVSTFLQDSVITGAPGVADTKGFFIGGYIAPQSPSKPSWIVRNEFKNLSAFGIGQDHVECDPSNPLDSNCRRCVDPLIAEGFTDFRDRPVLSHWCSAVYSIQMENTFENVDQHFDFGWQTNPNSWWRVLGYTGTGNLPNNFVAVRRDLLDPEEQGIITKELINEQTFYSPEIDALVTPLVSLPERIEFTGLLNERPPDEQHRTSSPDFTFTSIPDYPPLITLDATIDGKIVTLKAIAVDDQQVTRVELFVDWEKVATLTSEPYEVTVDLSNHPRKYAYLYARAFDGASPIGNYEQRAYSNVFEIGPEFILDGLTTPPTPEPTPEPTPAPTPEPTPAPTPEPGGGLLVSNLSVSGGGAYEVVEYGLETTALVYTDRDFTFTAVPQSVAGSTYIKTANEDKIGTEADFLSFSVNQDVTVYVGYDNRATSLPDWLAGWASTNESVVTTDTSLKLYSKDFPAGQISLGANRAQGASGAGSNHSVMILGKGPAPAPTLLSVQDGQAPVGGSVSIPIVLSEVGADGLAGYDIEVSIANSTIAEIASVDFPAFGITDATPPSGPLLSIRAVDTADLVQAGATNVLLATLNIRGLLEGTTSVNISVTSLDDDLGNPIMTTVISGNLTIVNVAPLVNVGPGVTINTADTYSGSGSITDPGDSAWTATVDYGDGSGVLPLTLSGNTFNLTYVYAQAGMFTVTIEVTDDDGAMASASFQVEVLSPFPTLPGMNSPAQDLDGDGHAEDVNGNGRLDFADIVALFEHMDSPQVQNNQSAFDFNDNGRMDMADIIALFDMLVS